MGTIIRLQRKFNLPLLTFYGVGNILGAGIYVLIGKVAAASGESVLLAFLLASGIAALSAFSYMELTDRFPTSAGAAVYVHHAYKKRPLTLFVGFCMVLSAIISSAALARGFAGYFEQIIPAPMTLIAVLVIIAMSAVAMWGIDATAKLAALFTVIEISGLIAIIWFGRNLIQASGAQATLFSMSEFGIGGVLMGAFLAFYAFIGFEDMVNVSEEVKNPKKTMPRAILLSLIISTVLYILVVVVATRAVPVEQLAKSDSPLALVFDSVSNINPIVLVFVGLAATINGILVQITMASRMLYGMANKGWINRNLSKINVKTKTPALAILVVTSVMLVSVTLFNLVSLARLTSFLVLIVFVLVNSSLLIVKRTHPKQRPHNHVPVWVPALGATSSLALIGWQIYSRIA